MNNTHMYAVRILSDHTVLPVCVSACVLHSWPQFQGWEGEWRGSSHSPEPTEDDSRWLLCTLLSEEAMINEQAPVDLTVYLDLLFLTQFPHRKKECWSVSVLKHNLTRQQSASRDFCPLLFLIHRKAWLFFIVELGTETCSGPAVSGSRLWKAFQYIKSIWKSNWPGLDWYGYVCTGQHMGKQ